MVLHIWKENGFAGLTAELCGERDLPNPLHESLLLYWLWFGVGFQAVLDWKMTGVWKITRLANGGQNNTEGVCVGVCVCRPLCPPLINPKSVGADMLDSLVSKSGDMVLVAIPHLHIWAEMAFTDDMRYFFPIRASPPHTLTIPPQRADWHWQRGLGKPFMGAANTLNSAY